MSPARLSRLSFVVALALSGGCGLLLAAAPAHAASPAPGAPAAPPAVPAVPKAWFGPPTVCHPIAIGTAASLPWAGGDFGRDTTYDIARVVTDTRALLDGSSAAFVHMETLRRAVIYLGDRGAAASAAADGTTHDAAWRAAESRNLVAALDARTALPDAGALAWFDLGYARAALQQMGLPIDGPTHAVTAGPAGGAETARAPTPGELICASLDKAAALAPKDGAIQLGVAIALFDGAARDEQACLAHLDRALALPDDPASLLHANLIGTMGRFLGADTHEALVTAVRERRQRG